MRPIFIAIPIAVYFILEFFRRLSKHYYTPVYFPFALEILNPVLARYYGTNQIDPTIAQTPKEIQEIKRRTKINGVISLILAIYIIPALVGFTCASFINQTEFYISLLIIFVVRLNSITRSVLDYDIYHTGFRSKKRGIVIFLYVYLFASIFFMAKSYVDSHSYVLAGEWWNYVNTIITTLFLSVAIQGVVFGSLASMFASQLLDESLRDRREGEFSQSYKDIN